MKGPVIRLDDPPCDIHVVHHARARRLTLRMPPAGGRITLTMPPQLTPGDARMFLLRQSDWLRNALARQPQPIFVGLGASIPIDGQDITVVPGQKMLKPVVFDKDARHLFVDQSPKIGPHIAAWLKARARQFFVQAASDYAAQVECKIQRITLRDTRSRWGSCSSQARLSFSWRLAMAPVEVQDYVAAHEVAHLVEMNHSRRYWAVLSKLKPDYKAPRAWLRAHGKSLHRYDFGG